MRSTASGAILDLVVLVVAGLLLVTTAPLPAEAQCTNTGRTCLQAKEQGLAWCRTSPNAQTGCAASTEMSYVGCLQNGTWKTRFCNRSGLLKK
jgi:hypothetical protein